MKNIMHIECVRRKDLASDELSIKEFLEAIMGVLEMMIKPFVRSIEYIMIKCNSA